MHKFHLNQQPYADLAPDHISMQELEIEQDGEDLNNNTEDKNNSDDMHTLIRDNHNDNDDEDGEEEEEENKNANENDDAHNNDNTDDRLAKKKD